MTKKAFYIISAITFAIFVSLLIVVSVYNGSLDYSLSEYLVIGLGFGERYSDNFFGRFFETMGEQPLYLIIQLFMIMAYIILDKHNHRKLCIAGQIVSAICAVAAGFLCLHSIVKYLCCYYSPDSVWKNYFSLWPFITYLLFGIFSTLVWYFLFRKPFKIVFEKNALAVIEFMFVVFFTILLSQVLIHLVIKPLFARVRYRAINVNSLLSFSPWYQTNNIPANLGLNIEDDFRSFPSGHTAAASSTFVFMLLPSYFSGMRTKKLKLICYLVPPIYTLAVAYSRIMVGAHYLSDVLFGWFLTFAIEWIVFFIERKRNKEELLIRKKAM